MASSLATGSTLVSVIRFEHASHITMHVEEAVLEDFIVIQKRMLTELLENRNIMSIDSYIYIDIKVIMALSIYI